MKAAVLHTLGKLPRFEEFPEPTPEKGEVIVQVKAAALRSSGLELYGSGGGSISLQAIFETFPQMLALAAQDKLRIETESVALADVENAWNRQDAHGRHLVLIP
jgi:D-arabinose 1-dehydrogenase-like Zn-dependent alcohol dehydrogenase